MSSSNNFDAIWPFWRPNQSPPGHCRTIQRVKSQSLRGHFCGRGYRLEVTGPQNLFLPILTKNWHFGAVYRAHLQIDRYRTAAKRWPGPSGFLLVSETFFLLRSTFFSATSPNVSEILRMWRWSFASPDALRAKFYNTHSASKIACFDVKRLENMFLGRVIFSAGAPKFFKSDFVMILAPTIDINFANWSGSCYAIRLTVSLYSVSVNINITSPTSRPLASSFVNRSLPAEARIQGASTVFWKTVRNEEKNIFL